MSYFLTEEQELMRNIARQFTEEEVKPRVMETYGPESHRFLKELGKRMAELGFYGVVTPEKYGGLGLPSTTLLVILEEIGKECPALGQHLMASAVVTSNLFLIPEAAKKWWPKIMSGDACFSIAVADPAGLANFSEWSELAVPDGDYYVLNGSKNFTTEGPMADMCYVVGFCQGKLMGFFMEMDQPGFVMNTEKKMGFGDTFGVTTMKNVRVHKDMTVELTPDIFFGAEHPDGIVSVTWMCAIGLGCAEGVFEKTVAYLKQRSNQGKPIAAKGEIQHQLVKMRGKIEAMRAMLYDLARLRDEGKNNANDNALLGHILKATMSDDVVDIARQCVSLHGGLGYCVSTGIERYLRDAMGLAIADCTAEMHWSSAAHAMGLPGATQGTL